MKSDPLIGFLVDPVNCVAQPVQIKDDLHAFYDLLDCRCIDIITRSIGGFPYDIVCDDEGLFKDNPFVSACLLDGRSHLVGALFVCGLADDDGDLTSLSPPQLSLIQNHVMQYLRDDEFRPVLLIDDPF